MITLQRRPANRMFAQWGMFSLVALFGISNELFGQVIVDARERVVMQPASPASPAIEATVKLELFAHPATAREEISVRRLDGRIELDGVVRDERVADIAGQIAAEVADQPVDNRLRIASDRDARRIDRRDPIDIEREWPRAIAQRFTPDLVRGISVSVYEIEEGRELDADERYQVPMPVVVVEGMMPSVRDQIGLSEFLLFEMGAAAVVNRTYLRGSPVLVREPRSDVRVRVPFVGVDVLDSDGVDVNVGGLRIRTNGDGDRVRVLDVAGEDNRLLNAYLNAARSDPELRRVAVRMRAQSGVVILEGRLTGAERMRAVSLVNKVPSARGVIDRTEFVEGGPLYFEPSDLLDYLDYKLAEHAGVYDVESHPAPGERIKLRAFSATDFNADLAMTVMARDPALAPIPVEIEFYGDVSNRDVPPAP